MNEGDRLFVVAKCGDPYNKTGWNIYEYQNSFDDEFCVFRGDLSPSQGRDNTILMLRRSYPGCEIRVEK